MSSKETRFSYVYKSLKCRITEGLLLPGSRLPSSRVLKDEYQVSLFTINKVLAAPVSYTHLDVYKRQKQSSAPGSAAANPPGFHGRKSKNLIFHACRRHRQHIFCKVASTGSFVLS